MKKLFIICSLTLTLPYALLLAADQATELVPQAPELPPITPKPPYVQSSNDLSDEDYFFCMKLTEDINPEMHASLFQADKIWGQRCFKATKKDAPENLANQTIVTKKPTYSSNGYPFFVMYENFKSDQILKKKLKDVFYMWQNPSAQEKNLNTLSPTLTDEEKKLVAQLIQTLTPSLYELLKKTPLDTYVKGGYAFAAVSKNAQSGYPVIKVNKNFFNFCKEEQLFFIGHELGHYAMLDIKEVPVENSNKYNRHDSSYLEGAANRLLEHECDHFSILVLKTSAKAAINWAQRCIKEEGEFTDLNKTHPSYIHRIDHFISLEREPQLNDPKKEPDWNTIKNYYMYN